MWQSLGPYWATEALLQCTQVHKPQSERETGELGSHLEPSGATYA